MSKQLQADAIVVGAGPAGIAAVARLLPAGRRVIWVDEQPRPGGQIWRGTALPRVDALRQHPGLSYLPGHAVVAAESPQELLLHAAAGQQTLHVRAPQLLLALGARERMLPFPGWTLPGVHGAGGLQALVKGGWPIAGRRVLLAGSGPLLLASAATLRAAGAKLLGIYEQAPRGALARFAVGLPPGKMAQALGLGWRLRGLPYAAGCWPLRALGEGKLEAVLLTDGRREWTQACDALGVGFGLLPNTELAELLGCALQDGAIAVDAAMQTSLPGVFAAGECTGFGGVDKASLEGEMAAAAMLGQALRPYARRHAGQLAFARRLVRHFALRPELLQLADAKTLICRCEDVTLGALKSWPQWRDAKLQTRCGMGACQGRICGPITQTLLGWPEASGGRGTRAPLQPVPLRCLMDD
ncbi:FAD/NAD(P)-binding oxidoreductase [Paucibacter soli]|uniref:FAD/NAD(P)-binding oxidoreductase n=1 Tax=Paucibacter soli TaxID=3133433 RepID=UPI00309B441C